MRILYIDFNYLFNRMLVYTIRQQRIKYNNDKLGKNIIILNKYNLVMDTILSIATMMDNYINQIVNGYDEVYIINNKLNVSRKLPSGYKSGYYIPVYKRFGTLDDIKYTNLFTTKLLKTCLTKLTHGAEIEVAIERSKKKKKNRKELFRLRLAKNIHEIVDEYTEYYREKYKEKWDLYDERDSAKKTAKISYYIKDFRMNLFILQNHLTDSEIKCIYNYLVKCCKYKPANIDKFIPNDDSITIFSDKLYTDKSLHMFSNRVVSTMIKYIYINRKTNKIVSPNMSMKMRNQTLTKMTPFEKSNDKILDIVMNTKDVVWKNKIIDIDQDNYINMFTEHTQDDLYNKVHNKSILTEYNLIQNYSGVSYVEETFYTKYMSKVIKKYKFENFKLV